MKKKKMWIFAGAVLLILMLDRRFQCSSYLGNTENLKFLERMVRENLVLAVGIYMLLTMVSCVVLALPGVTFAVIAGLVFGPWLGTLCCSAATTLGAMAAFLAGRFFLKDSIRPMAVKNPYLKKWLFEEQGNNGIFVLMITRLIPLFPYNLQNFAYGVTDIPFSTYAVCSGLFMLPGTAMYTIGAAGLADAKNRTAYFTAALALAVGVMGLGAYLKRKYMQPQKETKQECAAGLAQQDCQAQKTNTSACVHCHKCREQCSFLKKYQIDIGDRVRLKELAYHCFLCGRCSTVCPKGIDGKQTVLSLRRERVQEHGGKIPEKGYGFLLLEKKDYLYRNYRHAKGNSVLFPGCNFPSVYPETTAKLVKLVKSKGIGVVYDCCGKPVAELGMEQEAKKTLGRLENLCRERGIQEIITVCPNCYDYLREHIETGIKVTGIYEKMEQLGIGNHEIAQGKVFLPCPDREHKELLHSLEHFVQGGKLERVGDASCCGLGGCAAVKEPELAKEMASAIQYEHVYTYCASCSWSLSRGGCSGVSHVLPEILGTKEKPDQKWSGLNRMKTKFL